MKISVLSIIINNNIIALQKINESIRGNFTILNLYKRENINIFNIENDFSRRYWRCQIRIFNNLILTKRKGKGQGGEAGERGGGGVGGCESPNIRIFIEQQNYNSSFPLNTISIELIY